MRTRPAVLFAFLFAISGAFAASSHAQSQTTPAAPVPAQILSAKSVFIANGGGELDPNTNNYGDFSGGPDRAYNEFYASLKTFPRYELAAAPAGADLVMEISFAEIPVAVYGEKGGGTPNVADAKLRLVILDPKTHVTLWAITEYVGGAVLQGNREKNFDQAMGRIVADLQALTSSAPPASPVAPPAN